MFLQPSSLQTTFDAPIMDDPVALDLQSMTKGEAWINGKSIGRYWPGNLAPHSGCSDKCDYRGPYYETKCNINCGQSSQRWQVFKREYLIMYVINDFLTMNVLVNPNVESPPRSVITHNYGPVLLKNPFDKSFYHLDDF